MSRAILTRTVAAIDIGTTKICALIALVDEQGCIDVIGIGKHPSYGMKKGVVTNISHTVESIKQAVKEAERTANTKIEAVSVGISGGHIRSLNSKGVVAIQRGDVHQDDIDRVVEAAHAVAIPPDREVLHVIPQYFRVDNDEYVQDSLGMFGVRLEAQVHIITGRVSSAQNIVRACELAGVRVNDIVLEQLASADAVLTETERELGVGMLDIGGGTADFAIYKGGRIRHSKVIPMAGNHFTSDIAIGCNISIDQAERLKRECGFVAEAVLPSLGQEAATVVGNDGMRREIGMEHFFTILRPRAEEIFDFLEEEILQYRLKPFFPSGLVITGGGSLLQRLSKYTKGTWAGFINQPTNVDINKKFVVFSVRDMEDELKPVAMYLVTHHIWNAVRKELKKRLLVVDEAHWMMKSEDTASFLFGLAKRGRKYYLGLATITQDVSDFLNSPYGLPIITNSSIQLLLKQSPTSIDLVQKTFNLTDEEKFLLLESDVGEGIFFAGMKHVAIKVLASYTEEQILTSDPSQILAIREAKKEFKVANNT